MSLQITAQPTAEPVTLAEVKGILRLTDTTDDAMITRQTTVAREFAELVLGRSLAAKSYALFLERFPWTGHPLILPMPPLGSVTAVKYLDGTRTWQTWDPLEYTVGAMQEPGVIVEALNVIYPDTAIVRGYPAVEVDFIAGQYAGRGANTILEMIRQIAVYIYANPDATEASYPERAVKTLRSFKLHGF